MKAAKKKSSSAQGKKEYLQFIIQRLEKFGSLPLSHLTGHLSQLPSDVRKCIGTSLPEVKIFLRKYTTIFDVDHDDIVHLLLQRPKGTQNTKVKSKTQCSVTSSAKECGPSEIKNGKGHVQQLFSQTGFIQALEPFETPVYFTVQNFGDRNRQLLQEFGLKEGAVLHFNAIKEPPGSLTHYRATQVWLPKKNAVASTQSAPQLKPMNRGEDCGIHKATENKNDGKIEHVFDKFGFITTESTGEKVFFHMRSIANAPAVVTNLKEILKVGDDVEYCAVKSVKVDSFAPWEATHVFLKKYEDFAEISDDETFVSSSGSLPSQSDFGSLRALETTPKPLVATAKGINSETVWESGPHLKLGSLSPRIPTKASNSYSKKYLFSGRIYIRSEDDAIIISTKRHSCDIAVVDTSAPFYVNGMKVANISAFQNGQVVGFRAKKDQQSHRWIATLVYVGDKPNESSIQSDTGVVKDIQDNLEASSVASHGKERTEDKVISASCNSGRIQLSLCPNRSTADLVIEQACNCGDFAGNQKKAEEEVDAADKNGFICYMECSEVTELMNQDCVDKGHFMQEYESFCEDSKGFVELNTRRRNETCFSSEYTLIDRENAGKSLNSEHQNEANGSPKKVLETSTRVCGFLADKDTDISSAGGCVQLFDTKERFIKPTGCVHRYERCKMDSECRFHAKQNVNSPNKELCSRAEHDCQKTRLKTCCQISSSRDKVQEKNFPMCSKTDANNQNIMRQFAKEFTEEKFHVTSKEGHHWKVEHCRNCSSQQNVSEKENFESQEESAKSLQEFPSLPQHLAPKKLSTTVMDNTSELGLLEELQSVKDRLHKYESLSLLMEKDIKMPSPCLSYQDKMHMDIHHVSSSIVHGVLHGDYCGNSLCLNCKAVSQTWNGNPVSPFRDFGCQANLSTSDINKPAMETRGVQTYSTGDILYADIYPH